MKNGHLVIKGVRADALDLSSFTSAEQMTDWELGCDDDTVLPDGKTTVTSKARSVYDVLDAEMGAGYCEENNINELCDVFGQEFADAFNNRRDLFIHRSIVCDLKAQRDVLDAQITEHEDKIRRLEAGDVQVSN